MYVNTGLDGYLVFQPSIKLQDCNMLSNPVLLSILAATGHLSVNLRQVLKSPPIIKLFKFS